jgi:hypothetical protein
MSSETIVANSGSFHRLAADDVTGVLGVGAHGLLEEVVDPLEEIGKGESLGKRLAGLAV